MRDALIPTEIPRQVQAAGRVRIAGWLVLFFLLALLLPPLPFALGSSGPHVAILAAAAGLWAGARSIHDWRWEKDPLTLTLLTFFAVLLLSVTQALWHSGPIAAAGSLARVLLFGISVYVFLYLANGPGARLEADLLIRVMFWTGVASAVIACVDFYFQFQPPVGYARQFLSLDHRMYRRAQGVFYDAGTLGSVCCFFLVMIPAALFLRRGERPAPLGPLFGGGVILASALILSFSRGSLACLAVALAALLCLHRRRIHFGRLAGGAALMLATSAAALWLAFPGFARLSWLRAFGSVKYFTLYPNAVLSGRIHNWILLRDFLGAHPAYAIFGIGFKTLAVSNIAGQPVIADNGYLSALVETGFVGLATVIALHITMFRASYRASRSEGLRGFLGTWIFCFWAGVAVQMLTVDLLTYWRVLPLYFCVLALAVRKEPDEHPVS